MRIYIHITVTGKMFGASHDPRILHSLHVGHSETSHFIFILAKRAKTDDRIVRIIVDINHGSIINVDANPLTLLTDSDSHFVHQLFIIHRAQCELIGKFDDAI